MTIYSRYNPPAGFYVYAYLREDGTPYYIGKGKDGRAWSSQHRIHLPKNKANIIIVESSLTETGAFAIERRLIVWYGRKDKNTGILRNETDGGEGPSGVIGYKRTEEMNRRNSERQLGVKKPAISKALSGRTQSEESNKKRSMKLTGIARKPFTTEHLSKMSDWQKGISKGPYPTTTCPHCNKIGAVRQLKTYHFDNCKHKDTSPNYMTTESIFSKIS
jgi:hypothetical protein